MARRLAAAGDVLMGWYWNPYALLGILPFLSGWALATLVYMARPDRSQNRRLALLLALEACWLGAEFGLLLSVDDAANAHAATVLWGALLLTVGWAYLGFLGTLDTPLAAPFRGRAAGWLLTAGGFASATLWVLFPEHFATAGPSWYARFSPVPGPWIGTFNAIVSVVWLYALAVAFTAWRRVPRGSPRKPAARAWLLAVGFRDAYVVVGSVFLAVTIARGVGGTGTTRLFDVDLLSIAAVYLVSQVLLAYGILKTQLFDIDLKIRFAVEKSSVVAGATVAVFFVSELAEQMLGIDQLVPALVAAGLITLALTPLQRGAHVLANRLMPGVRDTDEYRTVRKREVYRAAVESALQDQRITETERSVLATLARELGLSRAQALAVERHVAATFGGPAPTDELRRPRPRAAPKRRR